jgi:hypothetical protein
MPRLRTWARRHAIAAVIEEPSGKALDFILVAF